MSELPSFSNQDWISFGALIVATVSLIWSIVSTLYSNRETNKKMEKLEQSAHDGLKKLDDNIRGVDKAVVYMQGVLDNAGLASKKEEVGN